MSKRPRRAMKPVDEAVEATAESGKSKVVVRLLKTARSTEVSKALAFISEGQSRPVEGQVTWGGTEVIEPPLDPEGLLVLYAVSDALHQTIDAMVKNVDGHGWTLVPLLDFEAEDALDQVATAIWVDRQVKAGLDQEVEPPPEDEVAETMKRWKRRAQMEKAMVRAFFSGCCVESSFTELRMETRTDREAIGWGAWEMIRDDKRRPARLKRMAAQTLRLTRLSGEAFDVQIWRKTSAVTISPAIVSRRLRKIVQLDENGTAIYFKEIGDPRVISSVTGKVYPADREGEHRDVLQRGLKELKAEEKNAPPATEVIWFNNHFPGGPYGQVRHHGILPSIIGSRLAQEMNVEYLEDSAIPRALLLVSGGSVVDGSVEKLAEFLNQEKGKAHNKIAIVQAETPRDRILEGGGRVQLEWQPLRDAIKDDATWSEYIKSTGNLVGSAYRIPPLLRGMTEDFNRATAIAALEYSEDQVFGPERMHFDDKMDRTILHELQIRFWRFKSRGPSKQDPQTLSLVLERLLKQGVVVPAEVRNLAEQMLNIELDGVPQDWQHITQAMVQTGIMPSPTRDPNMVAEAVHPEASPGVQLPAEQQVAEMDSMDPATIAQKILKLRGHMEVARALGAAADLASIDDPDDPIQQ